VDLFSAKTRTSDERLAGGPAGSYRRDTRSAETRNERAGYKPRRLPHSVWPYQHTEGRNESCNLILQKLQQAQR